MDGQSEYIKNAVANFDLNNYSLGLRDANNQPIAVNVALVRVAYQMNGLHENFVDVRERLITEFNNSAFGQIGDKKEKEGQQTKWELQQEIDKLMATIEAKDQTMTYIRGKVKKGEDTIKEKNLALEVKEVDRERHVLAREQLAFHIIEINNRDMHRIFLQELADEKTRLHQEDLKQQMRDLDERLSGDVMAERRKLIEEKKNEH